MKVVIPKRIVGEVSKNWDIHADEELISQRFEKIVDGNAQRGFALESYQYSRVVHPRVEAGVLTGEAQDAGDYVVNESIVAVFVQVPGATNGN